VNHYQDAPECIHAERDKSLLALGIWIFDRDGRKIA